MKTKGKATEIDVHIGRRLRARMQIMGVTQEKLGEKIDVTFQQIQKFLDGKNRITAASLWHFSHALDVPIDYFFEGLSGDVRPALVPDEKLTSRETLKLLRVWYLLPETVRRGFYGNLKMLSREFEVEATNG